MDLKKIKQIVNLVSESGVHEVEVEQDGFKIRVTGSPSVTSPNIPVVQSVVPAMQQPVVDTQQGTETVQTQVSSTQPQSEQSEVTGKTLKSPMVGTFYVSPTPGEPAFVKEGDTVQKGQTLCIIEAMKIMNEIEAETSGVIKKILVQDAQPVEFDQPLFIIE